MRDLGTMFSRRGRDVGSQGPAEDDAVELLGDDQDYVGRNREAWERWAPRHLVEAHKAWAEDELRWGIWGIHENELQLLSQLPARADIIEVGCGAAAIPAWLARRDCRPIGVDIAPRFVDAVARFQEEFGVWFPVMCANAEQLHFDHESFDCLISEYGASLWCNPRRWLPEAWRLLRPGGRLIFFTTSTHLISCTPGVGAPGDRLVRDYFLRYRLEFAQDDAVEFHLTHGHWIRLLRRSGFLLDELIEPRPSEGAKPRYPLVSADWARRWPSEEIWVATKVSRL